jgi:2-polyprenyl-6-methoxyphenol hydroxylase-like FAD-dependent oxidoreductase
MKQKSKLKSVIIIGAGISGLLSAIVASRYSERVLLLDIDKTQTYGTHKRKAIQSLQAHTLLTRGLNTISRLVPDFQKDLLENGATVFEWLFDTMGYSHGKYKPRPHSGIFGFTASKLLIEKIIYDFVSKLKNISIQERTKVVSLIGDSNRIRGVNAVLESENLKLFASLVIDCSGRGSQASRWLSEFNISIQKPQINDPKLGYATQWFLVPDTYNRLFQIASHFDMNSRGARSAGLFFIESNKALLIAAGANEDHPSVDAQGFKDFILSVPGTNSWLNEFLNTATPISDIYKDTATKNRWINFHKAKHLPKGFLALGDSVCTFNPIYGQGITTAALSAELLNTFFESSQIENTLGFQQKLAKILETPWFMATSAGLLYKHNANEPLKPLEYLIFKLSDLILESTNYDSVMLQRFLKVMHMIEPPQTLFHPRAFLALSIFRQVSSRAGELLNKTAP